MKTKIKTCCIIDDDPIFIYGTKRLISEMGLAESILVYNNGQMAIDGLTAMSEEGGQLPEVIILDLNMPILDGWDFLDDFTPLVKGKASKTAIYMMSSSIDPRDLERVKKYPIVAEYFQKPASPSALGEVLQSVTS
jgi:CheY-like chemotaxis protein